MEENYFPSRFKKISIDKYLLKIAISQLTYSAESAPLCPVEKFSIDRTVFFSSCTEVPPDVTQAIFTFSSSASHELSFCWISYYVIIDWSL